MILRTKAVGSWRGMLLGVSVACIAAGLARGDEPGPCVEETARFNAEMTALEEKLQDSTEEVSGKAFLEASTTWRATLRPQLLRADTMHADCWRLVAMISLDMQDANLSTHALEAFTRLGVKDVPAESLRALEAASDAQLLARIPAAREAFVRVLGWVDGADERAKGVDLCEVGEAYALGDAIPGDDVAANEYLERAVGKGSARAMWRLGVRLRSGVGCAGPDRAKGLALLVRSAEAGEAMGCLVAGRVLVAGDAAERDATKGEAFLQRGADAGNADCALALAQYLSLGAFVPKDIARAIVLAEKAALAESPNLEAALLAGDLHRESGPEHHDAASKYYRMVLEGNEDLLKSEAALALGDMLIRGDEGGRDEGVQLMSDAIGLGNGRAILALADHYATGTHLEKDLERAFLLWKASSEDDTNAQGTYLLAVAYRDGVGTEADEDEARRLMKQAAEMGHEDAIKAWKAMEAK